MRCLKKSTENLEESVIEKEVTAFKAPKSGNIVVLVILDNILYQQTITKAGAYNEMHESGARTIKQYREHISQFKWKEIKQEVEL